MKGVLTDQIDSDPPKEKAKADFAENKEDSKAHLSLL